jgi:hypothetical protein
MYTNEYNQEILEIADNFRENRWKSEGESSVAELPGMTKEFNQISSYHIYLKLAYEEQVDSSFMTPENVEMLRQTPNQTMKLVSWRTHSIKWGFLCRQKK